MNWTVQWGANSDYSTTTGEGYNLGWVADILADAIKTFLATLTVSEDRQRAYWMVLK